MPHPDRAILRANRHLVGIVQLLLGAFGVGLTAATAGCAAAGTSRTYSDARPTAPVNAVPPSRAQLEPIRPSWIGIELRAAKDGSIRVTDVLPRSPAARAGLAPDDVILRLEGAEVTEASTLVRQIRGAANGSQLQFTVSREGKPREFIVAVEPAPSPEELLQRRFVGHAAPSIDELTMVSGDFAPSWVKLRGQLVILEFWSPWCGVCRLVHQRMNEWQTQWASYGVKILGVVALEPEAAQVYSTRLGMEYAVASDHAETVFRAYDVFAVPSLFLVDRRGTVVDAATGYSSQSLARFEKRLVALVGEDSTP